VVRPPTTDCGIRMKDIDYAVPKTVAEAVAVLAEKGDRAKPLAGGTDIIVQLREGRRDADVLLDIKRIPELNALGRDHIVKAATALNTACNDITTVVFKSM